jgi:hypothetical protein
MRTGFWLLLIALETTAFAQSPSPSPQSPQPTGSPGAASEAVAEYLKDGKLTSTLDVSDLQDGVAGPTGKQWQVEATGSWIISDVADKTPTVKQEGKMSAKQLSDLAAALALVELKKLENTGDPVINPHLIIVNFNQKTVTLRQADPKPPEPSTETPAGRFGAVLAAVKQLCKSENSTSK